MKEELKNTPIVVANTQWDLPETLVSAGAICYNGCPQCHKGQVEVTTSSTTSTTSKE